MTVVLENYQATEKLERKRTTQKNVVSTKRIRKHPEHLHSRENFIYAMHLKTCDLHIIFVWLINLNECLLST